MKDIDHCVDVRHSVALPLSKDRIGDVTRDALALLRGPGHDRSLFCSERRAMSEDRSREAFDFWCDQRFPGSPFFVRVSWEEEFDRATVPACRTIIVEGGANHPKWAHMRCPCGC